LDESSLRIMSCGHVTAMRRILIGGARLRGCGNVAGALCPKLPCNRCEMRSAHSRCRISSNLITTGLVARPDSGCRITRARRTCIHCRTQSRARARAFKIQPHAAMPSVKGPCFMIVASFSIRMRSREKEGGLCGINNVGTITSVLGLGLLRTPGAS